MTTHFIKQVPKGDTKLRDVCNKCSHINYANPRVVVGVLPVNDRDEIELVERNGEWTLPYDLMRVGETSKQAAARVSPRQAYEADHILLFDEIPRAGIVMMTFRAKALQSGGKMFGIQDAVEKLAGNKPAQHTIQAYLKTKHLDRLVPGFLRHHFLGASHHVLDALHVSSEEMKPPLKACGDCSFDKGPKVKIVPGVVATHEDKILLAQRAIPPRVGYWTLPAGFMELGETMREGAAREAMEETGADIDVRELLAVYEIPEIGQIMPIFRGVLKTPHIEAGVKSLSVDLLSWETIVGLERAGQLAFPMVKEALNKYDRYKSAAEVYPCHMRLYPFSPGQLPRPGNAL